MLAVDTSVVVRLLVRDDERQAARAYALAEANELFIGVTVAVETEWVLRSVYGISPARIAASFRALAGVQGIVFEDEVALAVALDHMTDGLDFADALHLVRAEACEAFITFDKSLVRAARGKTAIAVREA